jgi:hypothetical protein
MTHLVTCCIDKAHVIINFPSIVLDVPREKNLKLHNSIVVIDVRSHVNFDFSASITHRWESQLACEETILNINATVSLSNVS